jgi:hypothetical protein
MSTPKSSCFAGKVLLLFAAVAVTGAGSRNGPAQGVKTSEAPAYTADGKLLRPSDYREWVFVTSGLGMTYGSVDAARDQEPRFDNVFVTRAAYKEFLETGKWPDKTMFVLEVRQAQANVSINKGGRTQGRVLALEASVKDRDRFPMDGWGYYSFDGADGPLESAKALPGSATCYSCHREKTAVDNTFVQFYPTLFEAAKRHGTIKADYDPSRH